MFDLQDIQPVGPVRRVDELGRIVLPKDLREATGVKENDAFEIFADAETGRSLLIPCKKEAEK